MGPQERSDARGGPSSAIAQRSCGPETTSAAGSTTAEMGFIAGCSGLNWLGR